MAELEERYIVFKKSDVARLDKKAQDQLHRLAAAHNFVRELRGVGPLRGVFIENDWPEYKQAVESILFRANMKKPNLWQISAFLLAVIFVATAVAIIVVS